MGFLFCFCPVGCRAHERQALLRGSSMPARNMMILGGENKTCYARNLRERAKFANSGFPLIRIQLANRQFLGGVKDSASTGAALCPSTRHVPISPSPTVKTSAKDDRLPSRLPAGSPTAAS